MRLFSFWFIIIFTQDDEIYIAPSGVQKERIMIDDIFIQNLEGEDVSVPPEYKKLKKSQCTPLFMVAYRERNAGACIHTHSTNAVMATLLWPGKEFRITHQEMIKARENRNIFHDIERLMKHESSTLIGHL